MDSNHYADVLNKFLVLVSDALYRYAWTFQQDDALVYRYQINSEIFKSFGIKVVNWLAKSLHLNIIKILWGGPVREVYNNGRQFLDVPALQKAIIDAWNSVDLAYVKNLYRSIPSRLISVLQKRGEITSNQDELNR